LRSFLGQAPILSIAIILCAIFLPGPHPPYVSPSLSLLGSEDSEQANSSKLSRIDFKGSFLFAFMILALLFPIELAGNGTDSFPWTHSLITSLLVLSVILLFLFISIEKRQREPILLLQIFHRRDAVLSFLIMGLQTAAQNSVMFSVPLYFHVTADLSNTASGVHLVPAVVGNTIGGLLSGAMIARTGRYKALTVLAVTCSSASYLLMMLRWHGNTGWLESLYIMPGGFGSGIAQSGLFIALQAVIDPAHAAPATAFMYLSTTVCMTIGLPFSNAIMQASLRAGLERRLLGLGFDGVVIQQVSD